MKGLSIRKMVFIGIMAALLCVIAPHSIPLPGLIPISLATFAVYLSGMLLGAKSGTVAVVIYILLGAVGLPVFSNYSGGFGKLFGVTGGYIFGYIFCAFLTGLFADRFRKKLWALPVGAALGTVACYLVGTVWYMIFTGSELIPALMACVVPFLIGDAIKIVVATVITVPVKEKLMGIMNRQAA